ncbi:MAG: hypothetical protein JW870_10280 [Candidatus Delongbacteria bacterium]|nr:hypothetical protein [Candidatus Delongbacteria bacterium]
MNNRINLYLFFLAIIYISVFSSCNRKYFDISNELLQCYKTSINNHDYSILKPYLSNDFAIDGINKDASLIQLYAYINFNLSEKINKIKLNKTEQLNDSIFIIYGKQYFSNGTETDIIITSQIVSDKLNIVRFKNYLPNKFNLTTRASYVNNEIFGKNRVENIQNLKIIDLSSGDSILGPNYTIFYDSSDLKIHAKTSLDLFEKFDSILTNSYRFYDVEREKLFLTSINSKNTCTVGKSRKIPWTMALFEVDSINNRKLISKIGTTFSHEIVEGCLVVKYNLNDIKFRWFRDGLSEYIAFKFCTIIAPYESKSYFIKSRLSDAERYKENGNLLDWRGDSPIPELDKGIIYGDRFIYSNEVGQYGRAFKLFKDLFENKPDQIAEILHKIESTNNVSIDGLLKIMNEVTKKNITELISEY